MKNKIDEDELNYFLKKPAYRKPKEQIVNNKIRLILDERNMTQQELSDITGILPQHLSLIIKNKRKCISLPTALRIGKALNTPVESLFLYEIIQ